MTWPSHDLTPQQTSRHQNTSLQSTKHHHHGTAEGSFTAKKWFGHRAGRSPCAHSIGKFFLCYISSFPFGNFRPRLVRALLVVDPLQCCAIEGSCILDHICEVMRICWLSIRDTCCFQKQAVLVFAYVDAHACKERCDFASGCSKWLQAHTNTTWPSNMNMLEIPECVFVHFQFPCQVKWEIQFLHVKMWLGRFDQRCCMNSWID